MLQNKSFYGGVQMLHGAVFSKRAPLAAGCDDCRKMNLALPVLVQGCTRELKKIRISC
jgi:hypothetical protein